MCFGDKKDVLISILVEFRVTTEWHFNKEVVYTRQGIHRKARTKDANLGANHTDDVVEVMNELTKH